MAGETAGSGGLRIGVTGHRPDRIAAASLPALRTQVAAVLAALRTEGGTLRWEMGKGDAALRGGKDLAPPSPSLVIVSSLAEGSDRLVAETAMARGDRLVAVLPFARAEFARDFATAASRAEFAALLDRAEETVELPGARGLTTSDAAYAAAAAAVLARSSVLLAIWDGEAGRGIGGTAHTVEVAVARGMPVVWIAAGPPHDVRLLTPAAERDTDTRALRARWVLLEPESLS